MILVTGGTGLVGSHLLLDLIKSGEQVRAIHRVSSDLEAVMRVFSYDRTPDEAQILFAKIQWMEADITDIPNLREAFSGIQWVYHCAAKISFSSSNYHKLRKANIEGTANVVNCCIKAKIKKLCFVSSIATLDKKLEENVISETSLWQQEKYHDTYAITKYGAEMEVWRGSQEGVPVVIVNPGIIIGPGFWSSGSGVMFREVHNGLKYHFPKVTGFVGVWDVVKAMRQLMKSPVKNEQFVLVSENKSFRSILEMVARSIQKPPPSRPLKPWMIFLGWLYQSSLGMFTASRKRLTRRSRKTLFTQSIYSSKKIKGSLDLDFEAMDTVISRTGRTFQQDFIE